VACIIQREVGDGQLENGQCLYDDWRRYAEVKANIRKSFMHVINSPVHVRHRTYVQMQTASVFVSPRQANTVEEREYGIARCLHSSKVTETWDTIRDAGELITASSIFREAWPPNYGLPLNQIVADYYHVC